MLKKNNNKGTWIIAITAGAISLLLVSSIFIQFKTVTKSEEEDLEALRTDELKTQIATYKSKYEESMEQYNENENKIQEYKSSIAESAKSSELLEKELEQSNTLLGLTNVEGTGVVITLKDTEDATYTSEDLRTLVNELKYAGAEAISINDYRVINLTDIATVGDQFITMYGGNVRISSPFTIKAIGDKTYLLSTLNQKNSGYVDLMKSNNLDITVEQSDKVKINKYQGSIEANYMKEVE